jgi:hypothetical protein
MLKASEACFNTDLVGIIHRLSEKTDSRQQKPLFRGEHNGPGHFI